MYCGISWAPCETIWDDLKDLTDKIPGLASNSKIIDLSDTVNTDDQMLNFIVNCYLSHEKVDSPDADLDRLFSKLNKKYHLENFPKYDKKLLFLTFEVTNDEKVVSFVTNYLKSEWGFSDQRILNNKISNDNQNHSFTLNLIKDFLRRSLCHSPQLDPYKKGPESGRKRILHTPATKLGCASLLSHLKGFIDQGDKSKDFDLGRINGIEHFRSLNFPIEKYAIMNSSWQAALGKRKNGDIDVLVSEDFLSEAVSIATPPVSIMKYVHWYCAQATGKSSASDVIKNHSVVVDGLRIIDFETYLKMMNVRKNSNTRFSEPAKIDLSAVSEYVSINGVPVKK